MFKSIHTPDEHNWALTWTAIDDSVRKELSHCSKLCNLYNYLNEDDERIGLNSFFYKVKVKLSITLDSTIRSKS